MRPDYQNLALEGGGAKGTAYVGALRALEEAAILPQIDRVAGASAGAIMASLVALGYTMDEVEHYARVTDFTEFMDDKPGIFRDLLNIIRDGGLYEGAVFEQWVEDRVKEQTGSPDTTFAELREMREQASRDNRAFFLEKAGEDPAEAERLMKNAQNFKDPYIVGFNLDERSEVVFSHEQVATAGVRIADAVRASMSIPGIYEPKDINGQAYVDGGLTNNLPVEIFDEKTGVRNPKTLGVAVESEREKAKAGRGPSLLEKLEKLDDFVDRFYEQDTLDKLAFWLEAVLQPLPEIEQDRVANINTGEVGTLNFELSEVQKDALIQSGYDTVMAFLREQALAQSVEEALSQSEDISRAAIVR